MFITLVPLIEIPPNAVKVEISTAVFLKLNIPVPVNKTLATLNVADLVVDVPPTITVPPVLTVKSPVSVRVAVVPAAAAFPIVKLHVVPSSTTVTVAAA